MIRNAGRWLAVAEAGTDRVCRYNGPMRGLWMKFSACALVCALAWGCGGRLDRLDASVDRMIAERQAQAFGQATNDPGRVVARPSDNRGDSVYETRPTTRNPDAAELPVERADPDTAAIDLGVLPQPLDSPEGAVELDLQELISYAIAHSPDYRSAKESLFLTALGLIIERHLWGPRFFDTVAAAVTGTPESGDFDTSLSLVNEFTVTQRLPYGGSVSASALVGYVNLLREASTNTGPGETQRAALSASLDLPLLRGAGRVAREDLIQAERDLIYASRDFERFRREFFVDIANTYFGLLRQQQQIRNQEVQLENLERLAERFEALAEAGMEAYFRAEDAAQQVLFGRSNLLNQRESYTANLDALKIRIGMPTTQNLRIVPQVIVVPEPQLDQTKSILAAHMYRLDLQTTADQVDDAVRVSRVAKNRLLPDLDVNASINIPTDADKDRGGVDFEPGDGRYAVGAVLDLPLDRMVEFSGYRAALIRLERSRRALAVQTDQVSLQVRRSIRRIQQAKYNLALQEKNVELAERRAIGVRLRERTEGPRRVIEAQEDLLDARNRRDQAEAELRQSFLQYLLDTGQMRVDANGRWLPPGELIVPVDPDQPEKGPLDAGAAEPAADLNDV